ncbi:MAG: amidase family protein [Proteobacteria bacterium]|nr:amidase family protein [Pseudomonadota bacterium]
MQPSFEILNQTIPDIVMLIKQRVISCYDLTRFVIDQAKIVDSKCNIIVEERFENALIEAKAFDQRLKEGSLTGSITDKPLLGIPFCVKASLGVEGFRFDMGAWSRHGIKSSVTCTSIKRLLDAGAILICSTNISEYNLWHQTTNPIYGTTSNPWGQNRCAGTSSGADAALVSGGGAIFALSTENDGSIRLSSNFCGLFGHKPSRGTVPLSGSFPYKSPADFIGLRALDSIGPMTRNAKDLQLILKIIAGSCSEDPMSLTGDLNLRSIDVHNLNFAVLEDPSFQQWMTISPEIRLSIRKASQRLLDSGAKVTVAPKEIFHTAYWLWRLSMHRSIGGNLLEWYSAGKPRHSLIELIRQVTGQSDHTIAGSILMFADQAVLSKKQEQLRSLDADISRLQQRLNAVFKTSQILLMPVYHQTAPRLQTNQMLNAPFPVMTGIINTLGMCATSAPVGVSGKGLPVGVQIIGPAGFDFLTIKAAEIVGEFIPPPMARGQRDLQAV